MIKRLIAWYRWHQREYDFVQLDDGSWGLVISDPVNDVQGIVET